MSILDHHSKAIQLTSQDVDSV